jgi:hypothetical protein
MFLLSTTPAFLRHDLNRTSGNVSNQTGTSGNKLMGLESYLFDNAFNTLGGIVSGSFSAAENLLDGASEWFVSQEKSQSNPNEDVKGNGNCAFASGVMLARFFGEMSTEPGKANNQIEYLRRISGETADEKEGTSLETASKGLEKLGLNTDVKEGVSIDDLKEGLSQGNKYLLAVNPEKYEEFLGEDLTFSGHAVALMDIEGDKALLFDPGNNKPVYISVDALKDAMGDLGNEAMEVSGSRNA